MIGGGVFNLHHIFIRLERFKPNAAPESQEARFIGGVFLKSPVLFIANQNARFLCNVSSYNLVLLEHLICQSGEPLES